MTPPAPPHEDSRAGAAQSPAAGRALITSVALLGALAGTALQLRQSALWPVPMAWAAMGLALAALVIVVVVFGAMPHARRRAPGLRLALACMAGALLAATLAFAVTTLRAQARLAERLPAALEGRDIVVTGLVAELPRRSLQGTRFVFEVEAAALEGATVRLPPRLALGWYRIAEPDALLLGPATEVRAGQRWRFTVRLKQAHGAFNPGGFDAELWLFERGIGGTGSVRASAGSPAALLAEAAGAPIERLRQHVRDAIERRLSEADGIGGGARVAGVIAALAIGDQAAIEREDWDLYRITGVAHLMSISGLHVTMFAWLAGSVLGGLWRRSARAVHWLPAPLAARWGGVVIALAYAGVAGWGVPAQRTVWMLASVALLRSLGLRWPLHGVLLAVAAVVVAADPWALMQPGFWLSFVAVALLVASDAGPEPQAAVTAAAAWPRRAWATVRQALRTQAIATVGLAPLTLMFFQQISLVGFVANLVAIPVVTLLVTPLALGGVLLPSLWGVAGWAIGGLSLVLQTLASVPGAVWQAAAAPGWAMAAGLLGGLVAVLPLPWRLRAMALPLLLPLLAPPLARPAEGEFELVALDIGQGTAALVRTRHHLLVYDTGPTYGPDADAGSRELVPLLRRRGEPRVDHLVLSHRDTDHVGGAAALLAALPVRELSSSLGSEHPLVAQATSAGATARPCEAGQRWAWDGVEFELLHPTPADYGIAGQRPNAMSCVLRVAGPRASVLLTGDVEAAQEAALVQRSAERLRAGWLLVPHHGSRTSSTPGFIDAVAPAAALAQAGYRSRFGHPVPDVVARYEARGITFLRSDRCGALTLQGDGSARCEREAARRYWHHASAPVTPPSAPGP